MTIDLCEGERQATLLALAELSLSRPGWLMMLREIAERFAGADMFDAFRVTSADRIAALPAYTYGGTYPPAPSDV